MLFLSVVASLFLTCDPTLQRRGTPRVRRSALPEQGENAGVFLDYTGPLVGHNSSNLGLARET